MSKLTVYTITVNEEQAAQRLDKWLSGLDFIPSRSRAAELIQLGLVTVDGKALKASQKVSAGKLLRVEIPQPPPTELQALDRPLEVLFEDENLIVVNKPAGLVVHPAAGHAQDTLVNILLHHVKQLSMGFNEQRPGIVHRLDRDTSGILVVAKNDRAHHHLAEQFRAKSSHRIYWALVHGRANPNSGVIRTTLARHPSDRKRFASTATGMGKAAITHYKTLDEKNGFSWIQCRLETGRTHQIRVHLSELNVPIVGDPIYGAKVKDRKLAFVTRMALHACVLGFTHPLSGKELSFTTPWPEELLLMAKTMGFGDV